MDDVKIKVIDSNKLINAINEGSYDVNLSAVMALGAVMMDTKKQKICEYCNKDSDGRIFQEIIVEYPAISTYPECEGKPYFSIKYTENGQEFIGYGTYKPEVLSEYLKEYFMPPVQPTLYGYNIELLAYIARVMEKEGVTAEYAVRTFDDMKRAVKMILDEAQQEAEEILNGCRHQNHIRRNCMRLIDADALKREGWHMTRTIRVDKDTMEMQTRNPTDFPTINPHDWIPVTEALPRDDEEVIVTCLDDSGDTPYSYTTMAWHYKGMWVCDNMRCPFVIAWMPLPEPWKGRRS